MAAPKVQPASGICAELNIAIDDLSGPASYTTGGVTVSASAFQLQKIKSVVFMGRSSDGLNSVKAVSPSPGSSVTSIKVLWFVEATGLEVGNGVNLSAKRIRYVAHGV